MKSGKIEIQCSKCGGRHFKHPANPKTKDLVTCDGCGAPAPYQKLMDDVTKKASDMIENELDKMFRKTFKDPMFTIK